MRDLPWTMPKASAKVISNQGPFREHAMKATRLIMLTWMIVMAPLCATAATLENKDLKKDHYRIVTKGGVLSFGTIYEQSTLYGICGYGCRIKLPETKQNITAEPEDHAIIDGGVLKLREKPEQIMTRPGSSSERPEKK